jgi:hypothetical protein
MPQPKDIILGSEKAASYVVIMRSASSTIKTLADGLVGIVNLGELVGHEIETRRAIAALKQAGMVDDSFNKA